MKRKLLKQSYFLAFLVTFSCSLIVQAKTYTETSKNCKLNPLENFTKYKAIENINRLTTFPVISLVSDYSNQSTQFTGWVVNNSGNIDYPMTTVDGINYTISSVFLTGDAGASGFSSPYWVKFRQDNSWTTNWGSFGFPSGTGVQNGNNINVTTPGTYNVSFNIQTGAYVFTLTAPAPVISINGAFIGTAWTTDIDLTINDGVNYSLLAYNLPAGQLKFRQNHSWAINWGSNAFPNGTGVKSSIRLGNIITATPAGFYDISFNRLTYAYSFTPNLSVAKQNKLKLELYPNPSATLLTIQSPNNKSLDKIIITDLNGKMAIEQTQNTTQVNIEKLASGMYILQVFSGEEKFTSKFIKQ